MTQNSFRIVTFVNETIDNSPQVIHNCVIFCYRSKNSQQTLFCFLSLFSKKNYLKKKRDEAGGADPP